mmetsp:Transcript_19310/g.55569  ORF Transcript_19310/g.55569 Transcript_19310/m.55569 type:complete len:126 (+) Transcript_19310:438-815(+)
MVSTHSHHADSQNSDAQIPFVSFGALILWKKSSVIARHMFPVFAIIAVKDRMLMKPSEYISPWPPLVTGATLPYPIVVIIVNQNKAPAAMLVLQPSCPEADDTADMWASKDVAFSASIFCETMYR